MLRHVAFHSSSLRLSSIFLQEVIQNADDARATRVKFILDHRDISTLSPCLVESHALPLLSNFQGPALLAYNDAVFTDSNWEGIQNLQQSEKVRDPFKVGKFGIGFNSVYHITGELLILSINFAITETTMCITRNCHSYYSVMWWLMRNLK